MQTNDHFIQVHAVRRRRGTRRRAATTPTPQRPIMEMQLNQEEFPSRLMDPGLMTGNDPNTRTTGDSSGMCRNKKTKKKAKRLTTPSRLHQLLTPRPRLHNGIRRNRRTERDTLKQTKTSRQKQRRRRRQRRRARTNIYHVALYSCTKILSVELGLLKDRTEPEWTERWEMYVPNKVWVQWAI